MKKNKRGLNTHQIRKISQQIFETKRIANPSSVDIPYLILTNSHIYTEIAEYVIKFRMVTWRNNDYTKTQIRKAFLKDHLRSINYIGRKLSLKNNEIIKLERLADELTYQLVADKKLNTHWATDYLVSLYREGMKWNLRKQLSFYIHSKPFKQIITLSMRVFLVNNNNKRNLLNNFCQNYIEREEIFFTYMPQDCTHKDTYHDTYSLILEPIIICTFITSLLFFTTKKMDIDSFNFNGFLFIEGIVLTFLIYVVDYALSNRKHWRGDGILTHTPFSFNRMEAHLKSGMLIEISDALDVLLKRTPQRDMLDENSEADTGVSEELKNQRVEKTIRVDQACVETKTISTDVMSFFPPHYDSPKKKKAVKKLPHYPLNPAISTLLSTANLPLPLVLVWKTLHLGDLQVTVGKTTKNIYPLWSGIPAIHAACQFWFIYFPGDKLKKNEDQGMIDKCTQILEQGHVVAPKGRPGIVREDENSIKIKMLSSAQGTQTTGNPSQWRFKFFRLAYPDHLREEEPKVGGHHYQLFVPCSLDKTH